MSALRWLGIVLGWWLVASLFVAALFVIVVRYFDREPDLQDELAELDAAANGRPLGNVYVLNTKGRQ